jgi:hypothetical protein
MRPSRLKATLTLFTVPICWGNGTFNRVTLSSMLATSLDTPEELNTVVLSVAPPVVDIPINADDFRLKHESDEDFQVVSSPV